MSKIYARSVRFFQPVTVLKNFCHPKINGKMDSSIFYLLHLHVATEEKE